MEFRHFLTELSTQHTFVFLFLDDNFMNICIVEIWFGADLFLFCYERGFLKFLSRENQVEVIEAFNFFSRYLDLLNIDNFTSNKWWTAYTLLNSN